MHSNSIKRWRCLMFSGCVLTELALGHQARADSSAWRSDDTCTSAINFAASAPYFRVGRFDLPVKGGEQNWRVTGFDAATGQWFDCVNGRMMIGTLAGLNTVIDVESGKILQSGNSGTLQDVKDAGRIVERWTPAVWLYIAKQYPSVVQRCETTNGSLSKIWLAFPPMKWPEGNFELSGWVGPRDQIQETVITLNERGEVVRSKWSFSDTDDVFESFPGGAEGFSFASRVSDGAYRWRLLDQNTVPAAQTDAFFEMSALRAFVLAEGKKHRPSVQVGTPEAAAAAQAALAKLPPAPASSWSGSGPWIVGGVIVLAIGGIAWWRRR